MDDLVFKKNSARNFIEGFIIIAIVLPLFEYIGIIFNYHPWAVSGGIVCMIIITIIYIKNFSKNNVVVRLSGNTVFARGIYYNKKINIDSITSFNIGELGHNNINYSSEGYEDQTSLEISKYEMLALIDEINKRLNKTIPVL